MASTATSIPTPTPARSFPMTRGRRAALVVGLPVCLLLVAGTALSLVADIGGGHYPVSYTVPAGTKTLTLNVTGQLTIKPTAASQATLAGTARYSIFRSKVTESTTGSATTVGYRCPLPLGYCGLDATVAVPATVTMLTASSGGGNATVTGTAGPVKLSTGDGNLSVDHASGPLTLNTDNGGVQVSAVRSATLSASSGNGNIQAAGVTSTTITENTSSGNIDGSGIATATITASTGNGDIKIAFSAVPDNVRVNSNRGNITLILPAGSAQYHVVPNSLQGTVSDTVPQQTSSPHVITASTGSGDITIRTQ